VTPNDVVPFVFPADTYTAVATTSVTGKRFVIPNGAPVDGNYGHALAGAGTEAAGVSGMDAASGAKFTVFREGIQPVTAGANLTAGQPVMSDATGQAIPWVWAANGANRKLGLVMQDTASAAEAPILLQL
jgi:hypothetical protein